MAMLPALTPVPGIRTTWSRAPVTPIPSMSSARSSSPGSSGIVTPLPFLVAPRTRTSASMSAGGAVDRRGGGSGIPSALRRGAPHPGGCAAARTCRIRVPFAHSVGPAPGPVRGGEYDGRMRNPEELYELTPAAAEVPTGLPLVAGLTGFADAGSAVTQLNRYLL